MNLSDKRVLITGADGFIGSHLAEMMLNKCAKVKALAYYNSFNNWGWLEDIEGLSEIEVVSGDIRDPFLCERLTQDVDVVFHLAALIAIPYSYISPQSYLETNVQGTLNICQSALTNGCEKLIHTSTSEVYGTAKYVPIDESHPLQPQSPYSASKIAADAIAQSFHNSFGLPVSVARPFNTYGPRQSARAVIPAMISQIASHAAQIRVGGLTPTRDFNFVRDTCNGMALISESDEAVGQVTNIGSGTEVSIGRLLTLICEIMGVPENYSVDSQRLRPEKSEVRRLVCDNRKLNSLTGFYPKYDLIAGLTETVEWFLVPENIKKYKAGIYNV